MIIQIFNDEGFQFNLSLHSTAPDTGQDHVPENIDKSVFLLPITQNSSTVLITQETPIEFTNGDRIYVVFLVGNDDGHKSTAGQFIIGHRKASPWEGYD